MKITVPTFRGEVPLLSARNLPENAAQEAMNCRLQSGDLESWRQYAFTKLLSTAGDARTIYLLNNAWLAWDFQVDVARGVIAGDDTFRTYLTSTAFTKPQFTNYAMATSGAEPYPTLTRPIGVPPPLTAATLLAGVDPTPTTFSINTLDEGDKLATDWSVSPPRVGATYATVTQDAGVGNPAPSYLSLYDENHNPGEEPFAYRNFGVAGSTVLQVSADFQFAGDTSVMQAEIIVGATSSGAGVGVLCAGGGLAILKTSAWGAQFNTASLASVVIGSPPGAGLWFSLRASVSKNADGTKTVTASIRDALDVEIATLTATNTFEDGDFCGFSNGSVNDSGSQYATYYDNYNVQASGATGITSLNVATSYVYTFVNDLGEESPPSPASAAILRPDGVAVTVTTPTDALAEDAFGEYVITFKNIYRAVTGATGTVFVLVAENEPLATATFVDTLDDSDIAQNDILESEEWDLPPDDLQGIIALPNGILAGFRRNQLCLSVAGRPHAWPVRFRYPTDTDIVAIANIDNTVVIGTKSFLYTCTGNAPDSYSMSKPGEPQACVSKLSMRFVQDVGVVYASPDGLQVCRGSAGNVENVTASVFTKRFWEALQPETILAAVHDGIYFFWSNSVSFALDVKTNGFGLIRLSAHAIAAHVDPLTDALYIVMDTNTEPTDSDLPVPSAAVTADPKTIYRFDGPGEPNMVYRWRGKLNITPYPLTLTIAQVRALGYANFLFRVYANSVLLYERRITSSMEFTLPARKAYETYELEVIGTSTVRTLQAAEDVTELT